MSKLIAPVIEACVWLATATASSRCAYPILHRFIGEYKLYRIHKWNIPDEVFDRQLPREWWMRDYCRKNYSKEKSVNGTVGIFDDIGQFTIDYPNRKEIMIVPSFKF